MYREETGDLFQVSEDYVLVHCIAQDFLMGAGIAVQFVKRYPTLRQTLHDMNKETRINIGDAIFFESESGHDVINLITKKDSYLKPTREDFNTSIDAMVQLCKEKEITNLAMPLIGSGIDQLNWDISSTYIQQAFRDTGIEVLVVTLPHS